MHEKDVEWQTEMQDKLDACSCLDDETLPEATFTDALTALRAQLGVLAAEVKAKLKQLGRRSGDASKCDDVIEGARALDEHATLVQKITRQLISLSPEGDDLFKMVRQCEDDFSGTFGTNVWRRVIKAVATEDLKYSRWDMFESVTIGLCSNLPDGQQGSFIMILISQLLHKLLKAIVPQKASNQHCDCDDTVDMRNSNNFTKHQMTGQQPTNQMN